VGCRRGLVGIYTVIIKPFNAELNAIRRLPALLEVHLILHVSRIRVKTKRSFILTCIPDDHLHRVK